MGGGVYSAYTYPQGYYNQGCNPNVATERKMSAAEIQEARIQELRAQREQNTQTAQMNQIQTSSVCADGKDDGKIGFWGAVENIGKGAINFFKGMVCDENGNFSLKRTLTTAAVIAGAVALSIATSGAATPYLIAAGVTMGTVETGKGVYKACTAKTDREAEAAFQNIGSGATSIILSVAGAKGALKASGSTYVPKGNAFTSSLRATGECFRIAYNGTTAAAKGLLHPMQSARAISSYWSNTMKPNLQQAFSWKTGHQNYTKAQEAKINENIQNIENQKIALNQELNNPATSAARKAEINTKLIELEHQSFVENSKLGFNNIKNKTSQFYENKITEVEAKLADNTISATERSSLNQLRNTLYEQYANYDSKFSSFVKSGIKDAESKIAQAKDALKTATGDEKKALEATIKNGEQLLKSIKSQSKIEVAQHNVQRGTSHITQLKDQLRLATTDAQKAAIESRIALIEKAMASSKNTLRFANAKIAAQQTLPKVGLAYGSAYLSGAKPQTLNDNYAKLYGFNTLAEMETYAAQNGISAEQLVDYIDSQFAANGTTASEIANAQQAADAERQALEEQYAEMQAQQPQQTQQGQYQPQQIVQNPYIQNPFGMGNMFNMPSLDFNSLYVSPYPQTI